MVKILGYITSNSGLKYSKKVYFKYLGSIIITKNIILNHILLILVLQIFFEVLAYFLKMSGSDGLKRTRSSSNTYSSRSSKGQSNISELMAQSKMSYEKLKYRYYGKHSEGNRFITDIDL